MKDQHEGYTLIELMITIAILGILVAVSVPSYQSYIIKARMGELFTALGAARIHASIYLQETGAIDCAKMPLVLLAEGPSGGGELPFPDTPYTASVEIDDTCTIIVTGKDDAWSGYPPPILYSYPAHYNSAGIAWDCFLFGETLPVEFPTCPKNF